MVAAGIRPNTEVALTSGFTVERAIVVDDQMRTVEDDDVYAVGECVQHRGEVYGLVAPLWEQAVVLADQITGADPSAAYLGSRTATKLKVAGVEVASMGLTEPERETDEHIVFSEPSKGTFKSIVIRDDKIIGATMLGDSRKVAFLQQAFDRGLPLPQERVELMFDLGGPSEEVGVAELADDAQVCNCNGVSKGHIVDTVKGGCKTVASVMDKTRAGKGCGSCKELVCKIVELAAGGAVQEDPAAHYYVPGIPMDKPALMEKIRELDLKSPSAVFAALAPEGAEDAKSKMGLASLLKMMWGEDYVDEKDARFINDRVHANIQKDGTFSVVPQMRGGVTTPDQLRRIADVADKYAVPMVKLTGGQRIDLLGIKKEDLPGVWADLGMPSGYAYGKSFRTVKTCVGQEFCRFGTGDSTKLGIELETRMQGMESPAKMKLAVSGCPRNCAESYVKDVGIVAIEGGRWEIYIGGAAGAHIRKGDLLCTVDDAEDGQGHHRPLPAVLPGERQVAGAHVRVRAPGRARPHQSRGRRRQRGHRRAARRRGPGARRHLRRPLDPGSRAGDARSVPHLAAAGGAASGAVRPRRAVAGRCLVTARHRDRRYRLGPADQIPYGEGGPSRSAESRSRSSASATAACARCRRSARTRAARSPTVRPTTPSCSVRCT